MRISDWSSDVCSSDLVAVARWIERLPHGGVDPRPIFRTNLVEKQLVGHFRFGRQTEHRLAPVGPVQRSGRQAVVPCAEAGRLGGEAQSILALAQRALRVLAVRDVEDEANHAGDVARAVEEEIAAMLQIDEGARSEEHTSELQSLRRT